MQQRYVSDKWSLIAVLAATCLGAGACQAAEKAVGPDVWAVVDGREVGRDEVEKAYRRVVQTTPTPAGEDEVLTVKLGIVDEFITQEVLLGRAQALGLAVTDAELETAFTERKSNIDAASFEAQLKERGLTTDDMKSALRRELTVGKVLEQDVISRISVTEREVTDYYSGNRERFNVAETQYRIAQIVVTPVADPALRNRAGDDAATPAAADRKVQMLMERLKGGADFAQLAMDYSEDPQSLPQGGDLGFIPDSALAQVPPELRNAVLRAEPGNVSVVSAGGGHTLVLLVAKEEAGQRDLSTPGVRDGVTQLLRERKENLLRAAYITVARNDATIVNYLARLIAQGQGQLPSLAPASPGGQ